MQKKQLNVKVAKQNHLVQNSTTFLDFLSGRCLLLGVVLCSTFYWDDCQFGGRYWVFSDIIILKHIGQVLWSGSIGLIGFWSAVLSKDRWVFHHWCMVIVLEWGRGKARKGKESNGIESRRWPCDRVSFSELESLLSLFSWIMVTAWTDSKLIDTHILNPLQLSLAEIYRLTLGKMTR